MKQLTIGLFGTCGSSTWRDQFIDEINQKDDCTYYNPQVEEGAWSPEMADIENQHFHNDEIILFPITNETTGLGSLSEVGFSVQSLLDNLSTHRFFVFMIDDDCNCKNSSPEQIQDSLRSRKLVKSKLELICHPNIFIVNNLDDMKDIMFDLVDVIKMTSSIESKYKVS